MMLGHQVAELIPIDTISFHTQRILTNVTASPVPGDHPAQHPRVRIAFRIEQPRHRSLKSLATAFSLPMACVASPKLIAIPSVPRCHHANSAFPATACTAFTINATAITTASTLQMPTVVLSIRSSTLITHLFSEYFIVIFAHLMLYCICIAFVFTLQI